MPVAGLENQMSDAQPLPRRTQAHGHQFVANKLVAERDFSVTPGHMSPSVQTAIKDTLGICSEQPAAIRADP